MIDKKSPPLSALDFRGDLSTMQERLKLLSTFIKRVPSVRRTVDGDFVHYSGIYTLKRSYALRGKIRDLFHPLAEAKMIREVMPAEHISAPQSIMSGHSGSPIPSDDLIVTNLEGEPMFCIQCYHFGKSFDSPFWFVVDRAVLKSMKLSVEF